VSPTSTANIPLASPLAKKVEWQQFDKDIDRILEGTAKEDVDRRLKTVTTIIVNITAERLGTEEVHPAPAANAPNPLNTENAESKGRTKVAQAALQEGRGSREGRTRRTLANSQEGAPDPSERGEPQKEAEREGKQESSISSQSLQVDQAAPSPEKDRPLDLLQRHYQRLPQVHLQ